MKRRILPMFMAVMMILSIIQMPAWAATGDDPAGEDGNPGQVSEQPVEESAEPSAPVEEEEPASNETNSLPNGETEEEPAPEEQADNVAEVNGQGFPTLQAAINEANGAKITLLADVTGQERVNIDDGETVTIDLNNHNVTFAANKQDVYNSFYVTHGTLNLLGTGRVSEQEDGEFYAPVLVEGATDDQKDYSVVNVGEGVTLQGWAGIMIDHNSAMTAYGVVVNVDGTLCSVRDASDSGGHALYINGSIAATEGNIPQIILDGATLTTEQGNGMYLAGYAETSIRNSTITSSSEGSTGIEIRAGKLTITDSTVTGGTGKFEAIPNGNGSTTANVALAVVQHTTKLPLEVTINSGEFTGGAALFQQNVQKNEDEAVATIKLDVRDGDFVGQVYSENVENFISGGTFSNTENFTSENYLTDSVKLENNKVTPLGPTDEASVAQVGSTYYKSLSAAIAAAGDGDTVTLLKDNATTDTIVVSENLTLDLHGCTLTLSQPQSEEPQFVVSSTGDLTIRDTLGNGKMDIAGSLGVKSGKLTLESGTIESDYYGIYVYDNGTAVINGGTINSEYAGLSGNNTTGDMNFEVNGGELNTTGGPAIYMPGQMTLKITGGTLNGGISLRMGQVTISGGTINATTGIIDAPKDYYNESVNAWLPDALYVFNGTYGSGNGTYGNALNLTITGGTFNCTNEQGSAIAIYDIGKVSQESAVTISGNAELSTNAENREAYQVLSLKDIGVEKPDIGYGNPAFVGKADTSISGGTFSSDPSDYVVPNKIALIQDNGMYIIADKGDEAAEVVAGEPAVALGGGVPADQQEAVKTAVANIEADGLTGEANHEANSNDVTEEAGKGALQNDGVTVDGKDVTIVVQPYLDIEVTEYSADASATPNTMTMDITPMVRTVATTADLDSGEEIYLEDNETNRKNAVVMEEPKELDVKGSIILTIPLPDGFAEEDDPVYIQHKSYEYKATATIEEGTDDLLITFVNPHGFSEFTLSTSSAAVADVDGTSYTSLQAAVDAVKNNGTITLKQSNPGTAVVSRVVTFDVNVGGHTFDRSNITAASGYTLSGSGNHFVVTRTPVTPVDPDDGDDNNNSGSSSSVRRYNIEADAGRGGEITPDGRVRVRRGENQTFRITADDGWEIADVEVDGESVGAVERYTFENVRTDHTISATFRQIVTEPEEPQTPALPFTDVSEGDWYHDAVAYCWENGIMDGTSGTAFAPNLLLNRAMMAQVLYNLADGTASTVAGFPDVSPTAWYADAVNWAAANGYVTGYDNGLFGPEDDLTREQLAAILYRYAGSPAPAGSLDGFADAASASAYAVDALRWAVGEGLLTGKDGGRLDPTGTASRAELAQILARFAQM